MRRRTPRTQDAGPAAVRGDSASAVAGQVLDEDEQEQHVEDVQQHAGEVKSERSGSPQRAVERERDVDERTRDVVQQETAQVPERVERPVVHDGVEVVPDERVVQRVEVDEGGNDDRRSHERQQMAAAFRSAVSRRQILNQDVAGVSGRRQGAGEESTRSGALTLRAGSGYSDSLQCGSGTSDHRPAEAGHADAARAGLRQPGATGPHEQSAARTPDERGTRK